MRGAVGQLLAGVVDDDTATRLVPRVGMDGAAHETRADHVGGFGVEV